MKNNKKPMRCTRDFLDKLKENGELWVFEEQIDPNLELARVQRLVCSKKGPAILFTNVKGTKFPVATNLYGSERRLDLAFGDKPKQFINQFADLVLNIFPPNLGKLLRAKSLVWQGIQLGVKHKRNGPVLKNKIDPPNLQLLPQIKSWQEDGGAFITLPLVYTESPVTKKSNLGMYRIQLFSERQAGMHIQINRGGGNHYHEAEIRNRSLPACIFVGGPPALTIAAIAPLPEDIPEVLFASLLMGEKLSVKKTEELGRKIVLDSDFAIVGNIPPGERKPEGPFGDHYGYYSLQHDYPFLNVEKIYHRDGAVFPATVVGRPPQEDHYITEYLQDILEPLYPLVLKNVEKVWAYEESGVHSLAGAIVKNRYYKEAFTAALKILGEGQLSLTKFLIIHDGDCDIKDFKTLLVKALECADFKNDLYILSNISQDTLDYTGPQVNKGSKAILMGIGDKKRNLKEKITENFKHSAFSRAQLFCPGALCVKGDPYHLKPDLANELVHEPAIDGFSMVFLVDDPQEVCRSTSDFIWHVFTRFEPAADIYGKTVVQRMHIGFDGPIVVDCRMKPWYPSELVENEQINNAVERKWGGAIDKNCRNRQ